MSFVLKMITSDIPLLIFPSRVDLTTTLLRFQEHYESANPEFRQRPFTIGEYRSYYANLHGAYTYPTDWGGFNFPGSIVKQFLDGLFDPLTEAEKAVVELFRGRTKPFYVIATFSGNSNFLGFLQHEVAHALYTTDRDYFAGVEFILNTYADMLPPLYDSLSKYYGENIVRDEVQAYLSTGDGWFDKNGLKVDEAFKNALSSHFADYLKSKGLVLPASV